MPPKQTLSNSLLISKSLTELENIKKDMESIKLEISQLLKYTREKEEKFIMVTKDNTRLQKELEDRVAQAWW
tara:strand:+ start:1405 stop:1620 length:216 start_codon:yes stop_codon:yes gene_type:complete